MFGVDDESMEVAVAAQLIARGLTLGVAESLTGGLIASRLVNVPGASAWFRGEWSPITKQVKFDVLDVPVGPVVSEAAAAAMARGVCRVTGSDVGLGITGRGGSRRSGGRGARDPLRGARRCPTATVATRELHLPGDRERVRQYGAISALDLLRRALIDLAA